MRASWWCLQNQIFQLFWRLNFDLFMILSSFYSNVQRHTRVLSSPSSEQERERWKSWRILLNPILPPFNPPQQFHLTKKILSAQTTHDDLQFTTIVSISENFFSISASTFPRRAWTDENVGNCICCSSNKFWRRAMSVGRSWRLCIEMEKKRENFAEFEMRVELLAFFSSPIFDFLPRA